MSSAPWVYRKQRPTLECIDRYRETLTNLELPEASGTLAGGTENGPIMDDAFDRGCVFN